MMRIYKLIEEKLGTEYENVFYQSMRDDKIGDVGIFLYESSKDLTDLSGGEVFSCIKAQVQVNAGQSEKEMEKALNCLKAFTHRIEDEVSNTEGIEIVSAEHLGPRALVIGRNEYNILVCRSLIDLKYLLE